MKVALLGFRAYSKQAGIITTILESKNHQVVKKAEQADALIVPHHMDHLFPAVKPWVAIWLNGGIARLPKLFRELENKPIDLIPAYSPNPITGVQREAFIQAIEKISKTLEK